MWLQRLTTRDPEDDQLEGALASIKAVLHLEEKYNGEDGKESFYYKIHEKYYVKRFNDHIDRVFWQEGDNCDEGAI